MPVITGSLSAVCSQVPHSESNDGISGQDRLDREGILLRELSLHVAKRRNQALHFVSGEKALSFRRRNRTNHVAAELICFKLTVARRSRRVGCRTVSSLKLAGVSASRLRSFHRFLRTRHRSMTSGGRGAFNLMKRVPENPRCHKAQKSAAA